MTKYEKLLTVTLTTAAVTFGQGPGPAHAAGAAPNPAPAASGGVVLPDAYKSIVVSTGALATSGGAALKTFRADLRSQAIRKALTERILSFSAGSTVVLDKDTHEDTSALNETALLCDVRQGFISDSAALNYMTNLSQQITSISTLAQAPTDIIGALTLFTKSPPSIALKFLSPSDLTKLKKQDLAGCKEDLKSYDGDFYGASAQGVLRTTASTEEPAADANLLPGFLGPIGTLVNTFVSIVTAIFVTAAKIGDETKRRNEIVQVLTLQQAEILSTGKQLAAAIDGYADKSRRKLAGSFVEQLVQIRTAAIDLSKTNQCKPGLGTGARLESGAPDEDFIGCWQAAWAQLQPRVTNLVTIGDNYDALADASSIKAETLFDNQIVTNYKQLAAGVSPDKTSLWYDINNFISLAGTIINAASGGNITTLKKDFDQVVK